MRSLKLALPLLIGAFLLSPAEADKIPACHTPSLQLPQEKEQALESLVIIQNGAELGSGVIISPDGYILTAAHVVSPAQKVAVHLYSGDVLTGRVLRLNQKQDVALIKIPANQLSCRPLQAITPDSGTRIYGMGVRLDAHRVIYQITPGQITRAQAGLLQTDTDLPLGNSGGPFLDTQGKVVGLISWKTQPLGLKLTKDISNKDVYSYGASGAALQQMLH